MRLIDSHCHFDFALFATKRASLWQAAQSVGVEALIIPAVARENFGAVQALCQQNPAWLPAYGLHPLFVHQPDDLLDLGFYLQQQAQAVGEFGLDFYAKDADKQMQMDYFIAQLDLAQRYGLPVILHVRKALQEVILQLRQYPGVCGVVHSFSGSLQQAEQLLDLGFKLGLGGTVTYPRAKRIRALLKALPLSAWLLETDAPDQPLCGFQGQSNHPAQVFKILQQVAILRPEPIDILAAHFYQNTLELFSLSFLDTH